MGGRKHRTNVYAGCSGGVVVVALGFLVTLEAFCKGLERSTQLFIRLSDSPQRVDINLHAGPS